MMEIMNAADFQTQLTSIMEMLAKSAVVEISKLFEENSLLLRLEISRCTNENESLKKKCHFLEAELQSARKTAGKINGTEAPFGRPGLADAVFRPPVENVFGKEWGMSQWSHEPSIIAKDSTRLDSPNIPGKIVNLMDEEPEIITVKEETFQDCSRKSKVEMDDSSSLTGSAMATDESCVAQGSDDDFITYTIPTDDLQSNVQPNEAVKQSPDVASSVHGDALAGPNLQGLEYQTTMPEEKRFECGFCRRLFNKLTYLKGHMRTHSGEKPFDCTICGKRFAQKTYLKIHQRIHSGEKPYTCLACGKGFAQKSSLNVHLRSHTGEKPYSCVDCGKSYTYKQCFNTHQCVG